MSPTTTHERHVQALRQTLTVRVARAGAVAAAGSLVINWWQLWSVAPRFHMAVVLVTLAVGSIAWAGFLPALPRVRALLLESGIALAMVVTSLSAGLMPGALGAAAVLSLLAAFLVELRTALLVTVAAGAWLVFAGVLHSRWPGTFGVAPRVGDLDVPINWVRAGLSLLALMAVAVLAMVEYLRSLTQVLVGEREALEGAFAEESRRQKAVEARAQTDAERRRVQGLQAVGKMGGGFAHELSNRLTVVRAELDALAMGGDRAMPHLVRDAVKDMTEAVDGAGAVLRRLLAASGRDIVRAMDAVDPADVVRTAQKQLSGVRGLSVVAEAEPSPRVLADLRSLHGVLLNLALNARDAMGEGGTLRLHARPASESERTETGCAAAIDVIDTGPGMNAATMARLFEPFFTTKGSRGTGLGLHAARRVVEAAGGALRVESAPARGTTFTVLLREAPTAAPPPRAPREPAPATQEIPVLIVDDDDAVRRAWSRALVSQGFRVFPARDVDEAIAIAHKEPIALAWMDAIMPGRPTRELIDELRRVQPRAHLVICSGHVEEELLRRDLSLGGADFVAKPCTVQDLIDRARRAAAPA